MRATLPVLFLLSACNAPSPDLVAKGFECPAGAKPFGLQLIDSVTLEETPATLLGNPAITFSAAPDGSLFVPDMELNRVSVFAGNGKLRGHLGRSGGGPGEFLGMGTWGLVNDTLVLEPDGGSARINLYDSRSLAYGGQIPYEGYFSWISPARDGYLVGLLSTYGVASLPKARISAVHAGTDARPLRSDRVPRPLEYRRYPLLNAWQEVKAVERGSGVLAIFGGTDYLLAVDSAGGTDTVRIPICQRRGAPKALLDRLFAVKPGTAEESRAAQEATDNTISVVLGLWRLPDGAYLLQFQDPIFEQDGRVFKGIAYLTLISVDLQRVCVDARVEAPGSDRARVTVSGDSIFVLDQVADERVSGAARTVVRKYLIDRSACRWVRVSGIG